MLGSLILGLDEEGLKRALILKPYNSFSLKALARSEKVQSLNPPQPTERTRKATYTHEYTT